MLTFKRENFTPAKAEKLLKASMDAGFSNRNPTSSFVRRYAGDMTKGHWQSDTGETIKVTDDGIVIDGQHRLEAVIQSGVSVKMWVCRGIHKDMFQYIDQGNARTLQDIMSIEGWDNPRVLSVTGKMLWRHDRCGNPFAHAGKFNESDGNIYDWILTVEPDLKSEWLSYHDVIRKIYNNNSKAIPESLMFYLLYQWKKQDVEAALMFAGYLSTDSSGDAPHKAMEYFAKYAIDIKMDQLAGRLSRAAGRHADVKEMLLRAADYAWDCVVNGKQVRTYNGFKSGLGRVTSIKAAA